MVSGLVEATVDRYLVTVDRLLEGVMTGFYVVGSVALGAYRPNRSDIDFVAVVAGDVDGDVLRRLRLAHLRIGLWTAGKAMQERRSPLTGTLNGVFIRQADIHIPVTAIVPVGSQVGERFFVRRAGSDVSPVAWKVLTERGIAIRGRDPAAMGFDAEPARLRGWTAGNLDNYWRAWALRVARHPVRRFVLRPRWSTAWGVLGVSRLHCTITSGEVIPKEVAGDYARANFPDRWHALISEALAYWREEPNQLSVHLRDRAQLTAGFVNEVIDDGMRSWRRQLEE